MNFELRMGTHVGIQFKNPLVKREFYDRCVKWFAWGV